jgi:acyl-CoA reductase-like NAD-dependent aldehyde dehydrogenase
LNSGQTCHAPTRLLVPASRMEQVKAIAAQAAGSITVSASLPLIDLGRIIKIRTSSKPGDSCITIGRQRLIMPELC